MQCLSLRFNFFRYSKYLINPEMLKQFDININDSDINMEFQLTDIQINTNSV